MRFLLLILAMYLYTQPSFCQYFAREKQLIEHINTAQNESDKVKALGSLANFYYIYRSEKKADSVLQKQFLEAEMASDKNLVLEALFGPAITNISSWTSSASYDKALSFVEKGLAYAKELGRNDLESLAYLRKASILRKRGQYDNALQQAVLAFSALGNTDQDSLKTILYLELGDIFLAKGEAVSAYKNFNNAYDLAYSSKKNLLKNEHKSSLRALTYHYYAKLYQSLGNEELALKSLFKSLELNKEAKDYWGLLEDYYDLAKYTDEKDYFMKTIALADSLQSDRHILNAKRLMIAYIMVIEQNSKKALDYLNRNEDLKQSYLNLGEANYNWTIGNIYRYSNKPDSAIYYYSLAEPQLEESFDPSLRKSIYEEMANCYLILKNYNEAVIYYGEALGLSQQANDFTAASRITLQLSEAYAKLSDFKQAYAFKTAYLSYKDTLLKLSAQRDVTLLELERENRRHEKDLAALKAKDLKTRNLQYMGISIAIASVFLTMILLGMFPVSRVTIKMLCFFAFICLFEFIVLLIDSYLHKLVHGEPLKIWGVKIFLITMLVPLQHYMEHGVVRFLESRRLLKMRQNFSIRRLVNYMKKPVSTGHGIEEDTAVL